MRSKNAVIIVAALALIAVVAAVALIKFTSSSSSSGTPTTVPFPTPLPTGTLSPAMRAAGGDRNKGDAKLAVLGGNLAGFVARFGAPGPAPARLFGRCAGGSYGNYQVSAAKIDLNNPSFGTFTFVPPFGVTQLVTAIHGGYCGQGKGDAAAMLREAMRFFPPDAGRQIGSCSASNTGSLSRYWRSKTFASDVRYRIFGTGAPVDCHGKPLPAGTFTWQITRDPDGHWTSHWALTLAGG